MSQGSSGDHRSGYDYSRLPIRERATLALPDGSVYEVSPAGVPLSDMQDVQPPANPFLLGTSHSQTEPPVLESSTALGNPFEQSQSHQDTTRRRGEQVYPLGTRADVEAADYVSPISNMFVRAYQRYSVAEETRRAETNANRLRETLASRTGRLFNPDQDMTEADLISDYDLSTISSIDPRHLFADAGAQLNDTTAAEEAGPGFDGNSPNAIDLQNRPAPLKDEDMKVSMACKICHEQLVDTVAQPCNHLVMCRWCAMAWMAHAKAHQAIDPHFKYRCPLCRRAIKTTLRVHLG